MDKCALLLDGQCGQIQHNTISFYVLHAPPAPLFYIVFLSVITSFAMSFDVGVEYVDLVRVNMVVEVNLSFFNGKRPKTSKSEWGKVGKGKKGEMRETTHYSRPKATEKYCIDSLAHPRIVWDMAQVHQVLNTWAVGTSGLWLFLSACFNWGAFPHHSILTALHRSHHPTPTA